MALNPTLPEIGTRIRVKIGYYGHGIEGTVTGLWRAGDTGEQMVTLAHDDYPTSSTWTLECGWEHL